MSVPVNQRTHGKLETLVKARTLCVHTLTVTKNENLFPPAYKATVTDKIVNLSIDIFVHCFSANDVYVNSHEDYMQRIMLQEQAAAECDALLALIQIAKSLFHLDSRKVKYWAELAIEAKKLIKAWKDSDSKRYKEYR